MDVTAYGVIISGVVIGCVQVLKTAGLPTKYCPLVATVLGLIFGLVFLSDGDYKRGAILGLACGLSACGLYDNGKKITQ